jgi:hypothetical protein
MATEMLAFIGKLKAAKISHDAVVLFLMFILNALKTVITGNDRELEVTLAKTVKPTQRVWQRNTLRKFKPHHLSMASGLQLVLQLSPRSNGWMNVMVQSASLAIISLTGEDR